MMLLMSCTYIVYTLLDGLERIWERSGQVAWGAALFEFGELEAEWMERKGRERLGRCHVFEHPKNFLLLAVPHV